MEKIVKPTKAQAKVIRDAVRAAIERENKMSNSDYGFSDDTVFCVMLEQHVVKIFRDWKAANEFADARYIRDTKAGHDVDYVVVAHELT